MKPWYESASYIEKADVEIGFILFPDFYYGPDIHPNVIERKEIEPLCMPSFSRRSERLATTSEVEFHIDELITYYRDVIRLSRKHNKSFNQIRQYFWIRLFISNNDHSFNVSFPWYDTLSEMIPVLTSLENPPSQGELHWDRDQGWEFEMDSHEGMLFIREWDPDAEEVYVTAKMPLGSLSVSSKAALQRARKIISAMATALTDDPWTNHKTKPTFSNLLLPTKQ